MISDSVVTITDPVPDMQRRPGLIGKIFGPLVRDERDLPFVRLSLFLTITMVPLAVALFIPGIFRWWLAPVYWVLFLWFTGPFILMLHCTSHRILFKREYDILNKYIPWMLGVFMGQSPETYFVHHIGMHHTDGNLPDDLSSTMPYQRDSFVDWLKYIGRFLFIGDFELYRYMMQRGRRRLAIRLVVGETFHFALMIAALLLNWRAALVVFVVPTLVLRILLMIGNWAQHAFVDPDDPLNDYRTVVTFINSPYNRRCWNDGYHLGHHLKPTLHWLDMPADMLAKREQMIANQSLVFQKIDYFVIFLMLMFKRYRMLAKYHVNLDPSRPVTEDEVISLIKRRVKKFDREQLATIRAAHATA
ncbi:MAG: fatty acid desaturase [Gemmatimonadota bacterium]|nr:fatty acid desaturase [Gemmatimonadota bacterium]